MIKFIQEEKEEELRFDKVDFDQFFINCSGCLCQKIGRVSYNKIANVHGKPNATQTITCSELMPVTRILPKVTKIEF